MTSPPACKISKILRVLLSRFAPAMAEDGGEDEEVSLKPFRIVEPRMRQLVHTVVPRSLTALQQHQQNIAHHLTERDWDRVNTEQINAARTAQQLKDHLHTLQELREQVVSSEVSHFDSRVEEVEQQLQRALVSYGLSVVASSSSREGGREGREGEATLLCVGDGDSRGEDMANSQFEVLPSTVADHSSMNRETQESWEQLKTELDELRDIMDTLTKGVQSHQSKVTNLGEHLDLAGEEVKEAQSTLSRATRHNIKSYVLPVGGAVLLGVVGGLVGGPIGLVAGANIGAAAALTGVAAGGVSGGLLGRRIYKSTLPPEEIELREMKKKE